MIPSRHNPYSASIYHRKENSNEYEETPYEEFTYRTANHYEIKSFSVVDGLINSSTGYFIFTNDLKELPRIDDKVILEGREMLVDSFGYYRNYQRLVNARSISQEHLNEMCPKGIRLV